MLATALTLLVGSQQAEEEAVYRMLSLSQRSLASDRPLPLRLQLDDMVQSDGTEASTEKNKTALQVDSDGHPTAISRWAGQFAEDEQAVMRQERPMDRTYLDVARSLHEGHFAAAQKIASQLSFHCRIAKIFVL